MKKYSELFIQIAVWHSEKNKQQPVTKHFDDPVQVPLNKYTVKQANKQENNQPKSPEYKHIGIFIQDSDVSIYQHSTNSKDILIIYYIKQIYLFF